MYIFDYIYICRYALNNQLVASYNVRSQSHENLLVSLKEVNHMIQKAANLRMGSAKSRVISECRMAVKKNNLSALYKIINKGYENTRQTNKKGGR